MYKSKDNEYDINTTNLSDKKSKKIQIKLLM